MDIKEMTLSNGMKLISCANTSLNRFCIGLYFHGGPLFEDIKTNGLGHLLEHLFFREMSGKTQAEIFRAYNNIGGYLRGSTYPDYIRLDITASAEYFNEAFEIMFNSLQSCVLSQESIDDEKAVVIKQIEHKPGLGFSEYYLHLYLMNTRYSWFIMGNIDTLRAMSMPDINAARKRLVSADNICCIISGNFSEKDFANAAGKLKGIPVCENSKIEAISNLPKSFCERDEKSDLYYHLTDKEDDISNISIIFDIDPNKVNSCAADILTSVLSQGDGSLLSMELREKYAYTDEVYARSIKYKGFSIIEISFAADMYNIVNCLKIIFESLQAIKSEITNEQLLENLLFYAKNQRWLYDDPRALQTEIGWHYMSLNDTYLIEDIIAEYERIDVEILKETAGEIFRSKNMSVFISYNSKIVKKSKLKNEIADFRRSLN